MPVQRLLDFLKKEHVKFVTINHSPAYTAQEIAACTHTPGKDLAKTVVVRVDGQIAMAVLPASLKVDFDVLRDVLGAHEVDLVPEREFSEQFPDCEVGAMPPFGNLYGMPVYVAESLIEDDEIAFNAGSHTQLVRMAYADYARLVQPRVAQFAMLS